MTADAASARATAPADAAPSLEVWLGVPEVSALMGVSPRHVYRMINEERVTWRQAGRSREVLLSSLTPNVQRAWHEREAAPEPVRTCFDALPDTVDKVALDREATRRWELLRGYFEAPARRRTPARAAELVAAIAAVPLELAHLAELTTPRHIKSLQRTHARARQHGREYTLGRLGPRVTARTPTLNAEGRRYLRWLWIDRGAASPTIAWRTYIKEARRKGWPEVSLSTIRRYLQTLPADVCALGRKGMRAFEGQDAPYVVRDWSGLVAGAWLNGDHHQLDIFVRDEQTGKLFRPWLTGWQDLRSRALWGWQLVDAPNSRTIMEALVHAIRPKHRPEYERMCGVPDDVLVDNGKDYRSRLIEGEAPEAWGEQDQVYVQGILGKLGIAPDHVHHALPYNAKSKPIERFFRTMCLQFTEAMMDSGYVGNSPARRPDRTREAVKVHERWLKGLAPESPFMTLQQFCAYFDAWLLTYHRAAHAALSADGVARSPLDVIRLYGRAPRLVRDTSLELMVMLPSKRTVRKGGCIQLGQLWYQHNDLIARRGEEVLVCRAQGEHGRVYVYDSRQQFICEALSRKGLRMDDAGGGEAGQAERESYKRYLRELRARKRELTEGVDGDALTPREALIAEVPPPSAEPCRPAEAVVQMSPRYDRIELQAEQLPAEPPAELVLIDDDAPEPPAAPKPKLIFFEADRDDSEETDQAAEGGRGGTPW